MKNILIFLFLTISLTAVAQTRSVNQFIRQTKKEVETTGIRLPGWLVKFGFRLSGETKNLTNSELLLLESFKGLRVLTSEDEGIKNPKRVNKLMASLKEDGFETLMRIRDGKENVGIFMRQKKGKIKNILIIASEENEFALVNIKSKLKMEQLENIELPKDFSKDFIAQIGVEVN